MDISHKQFTDQIIVIITKHIKTKHLKVFYFGSRVNGQASERSDIDIGIEADEVISNTTISEIKEELENLRTLKKFDLIDFKSTENNFKDVALKNIEVIYER